MVRYMIDNRRELFLRFFISAMGIMFVTLFSYSTSWFYPDYYGGDSAQFLTIGKAWMLGKIPYRDMFDHKGPVIFFVDMLGFMLTGNKSGVAVIQCVFIIVTLNALFSLGKLQSNSDGFGVIVSVICLILYKLCYVDGNAVEEYCLPFIAISTYYQTKFFEKKREEHSPYAAAFYGIAFGICAMTRITNAVMICSGVFVIAIFLMSKKKYSNLCANVCGFLAGLALIVLPFALYFFWHGCFSDFIYGTLIFNIEYTNTMEPWIKYASTSDLIEFLMIDFSYICAAIVTALALKRKVYGLASFCALSFAVETYLLLSGQRFAQYPAVCLPQIALLLNELYLLRLKRVVEGMVKSVTLLGILILCAHTIKDGVSSFMNMYSTYHNYGVHSNYEVLITQIPIAELDSFEAYGDNRFKEVYLAYNLMPSYRYFVIQEWHASFSDFVKEDIRSVFMKGDAKWILTAGSVDNIADILEQRYEIYDSVEDYALYRLR